MRSVYNALSYKRGRERFANSNLRDATAYDCSNAATEQGWVRCSRHWKASRGCAWRIKFS